MLGWLVAAIFGGLSGFLAFKQYRDFRVARLEERLSDLLVELEGAEETTAGLPELIEAQRRGATRLIKLVPAEFTMTVVHSFVKLDRLEREQATVLAEIMTAIETAKTQSARKWLLPPTPAEFNRLNLQAERSMKHSQKLTSDVEAVRHALLNMADARSHQVANQEPAVRDQILEATN